MPEFPWEQAPWLRRELLSTLKDVLERHESLRLLCLLNGGIPITLAMSWFGEGSMCLLVILFVFSAFWVQSRLHRGHYNRRHVALWGMMVATNMGAPFYWMMGREEPALYLWGVPNLLGQGWALWRWLRERRRGSSRR
jgi:hypothetical protein